MIMHLPLLYLVALALLSLAACTAPPEDPEAQVRTLLDQFEEAVEARDVTTLKGFLSEKYRDERGRGRNQVADLAAVYFLQHRSIHLLTRLDSLGFAADSTEAQARLFVAMAGRALPNADALGRAALYRFDVALAYEGPDAWKVREARWQRAEAKAFF